MHFLILMLTVFINLISCETFISLSLKPKDAAVHVTDKMFFSIALDTSVVADHFKDFDMKNRRLSKLIKELNPGYLRIGGNMADRLHFQNISESVESYNFNFTSYIEECAYEELLNCQHDFPNFTMSGEEWKDINNFAKNVGAKILFDLNCLIRNKDGSWDSDNAEELISFSNYYNFDIDWQLGNEPNAFKHVFNYSVNASQLAKDFAALRTILNKYTQYKNSVLVGPDITRPKPKHKASENYLRQFLHTIEENVLNAVSFHQYYLNGRTATVSDFLNTTIFALLEQQINIINAIVKNSNFSKLPVWLTETSSAYGGGAPGLSDSFVGSFLWLDKLGLSAKLGVKVVVRQSIKHNSYALIDKNYNPNPDWWLSVLYNKLVGPEVLNCNVLDPKSEIRLYCQCTAFSQIPTITVFGINISNTTVYIKIEGIQQTYYKSSAYILTADKQNLLTKKILLNGKLLELSEDADLPAFFPKNVDVSKPLVMPAYSLAFWTVPAMDAKLCSRPNVMF